MTHISLVSPWSQPTISWAFPLPTINQSTVYQFEGVDEKYTSFQFQFYEKAISDDLGSLSGKSSIEHWTLYPKHFLLYENTIIDRLWVNLGLTYKKIFPLILLIKKFKAMWHA